MTIDHDICYRALSAHDARFDGIFFVGVTTTGIYCRPVCRARLPRADRCRFFPSAAAAETAGFRPCLRCRPEKAPGRAIVDAPARLARSAAAHIAAGALNDASIEDLAERLYVGARQLRRVVRREYGSSPVQLAQTHRLLLAKALLTESTLSMTDVAFASGFASLRRFNALFRDRYGMSPRRIRRARTSSTSANGAPATAAATGAFTLALDYRPPLDWDALLAFLAARAVPGVEVVEGGRYSRTFVISEHRGWVSVKRRAGDNPVLNVDVALPLAPVLMPLLARLRNLFDLDAEPSTIEAHLGADPDLSRLVRRRPGLRVPGAADGFELALRAVLGQQVSVRAATTLAGRVADAFAEPAELGHPSLNRFPVSAERLADAGATTIAALGMPRARAECVAALARSVAEGALRLEPGAPVEQTLESLRQLNGVGPWTAQYIALRALHWPDAFPHHDLGLRKAYGGATSARLLETADRWRPWRAYAAVHLWQSLTDAPSRNGSRPGTPSP
ncbi:MAG: DNA-3-methyladenine glycosylase 2 [Longimicrobiales bacterium]